MSLYCIFFTCKQEQGNDGCNSKNLHFLTRNLLTRLFFIEKGTTSLSTSKNSIIEITCTTVCCFTPGWLVKLFFTYLTCANATFSENVCRHAFLIACMIYLLCDQNSSYQIHFKHTSTTQRCNNTRQASKITSYRLFEQSYKFELA